MAHDFAKTKKSHSESKKPEKKPASGWVWLTTGFAGGLFVSFLVYLVALMPSAVQNNALTSLIQEKTAQAPPLQIKEPHRKPKKTVEKPRFDFYTLLPKSEVTLPEDPDMAAAKPVVLNTAVTQTTGAETAAPKVADTAIVNTETGGAETAGTDTMTAAATTSATNIPAADIPEAAPKEVTAETKKEVTSKVEVAAKETVTPASQIVQYSIQAGAFRDLDDADELRVEILLMGLDAEIKTVQGGNQSTLHRVLVGPFSNPSQMARVRGALSSNGINTLVLTEKAG